MRYEGRVLAVVLAWGVGLLLGVGRGEAQEGADRKADEAVIRAAAKAYAEAFNKRDVKAIVADCTEDVTYVDETGRIIRGREALAKDFERFFAANPIRKIHVEVETIQFVKPDVAVVDGAAELNPPLGGKPVAGRYTAVRIKQNGKWMVASVREVAEELPSNYDRLKELEWMIGDWMDEGEGATVRSTVRWARNKNFLIGKFAVKAKGKDLITGTQRIGWDASKDQIRSWVFDSDGAFFEGFWIREGNQWVVRITGTLQDGAKASATSTYTFIDNDTHTFQSRDRVVDGEPVPDVEEVKVMRVPPTAE